MSEDPWNALASPGDVDTITARRVDETNRWNFFWGRDSESRCLLVLRYGIASQPLNRLPRLKGVEIFVHSGISNDEPSLVLRLLDPTLRDIFYRLCTDIIGSTSRAPSEQSAVATAVARTWRWHHLLRGGSGLLSAEEQKGLIAELLVLEDYFLTSLSPAASIEAWRGPLGAAQDFLVGKVAIESKALATSGNHEVLVNSEFQLEESDLTALYLHVSVLDPVTRGEETGFSLSEVAGRLKDRLALSDPVSASRFEALLAAAGVGFEDDYSQTEWKSAGRSIYRVEKAFPRLTPATLPEGISRAKYLLSLSVCGAFLTSSEVLVASLAAGSS